MFALKSILGHVSLLFLSQLGLLLPVQQIVVLEQNMGNSSLWNMLQRKTKVSIHQRDHLLSYPNGMS